MNTTDTRFQDTTSDKFQVLKTMDVVKFFENAGFTLHEFKAAKAKPSRQGFQKHIVTLKATNLATSEGVPTIVFRNAHDGSSSGQFFVGYIRFACLNGCIFGTNIVRSERIIHKGQNIPNRLDDILAWALEECVKLNTTVIKLQSIQLTKEQKLDFIKKAASIRNVATVADEVRRDADVGDSLWNVYQRTQESLVRGTMLGFKTTDNGTSKRVAVRPIKSVVSDLRINTELSNLLNEYLAA